MAARNTSTTRDEERGARGGDGNGVVQHALVTSTLPGLRIKTLEQAFGPLRLLERRHPTTYPALAVGGKRRRLCIGKYTYF